MNAWKKIRGMKHTCIRNNDNFGVLMNFVGENCKMSESTRWWKLRWNEYYRRWESNISLEIVQMFFFSRA